MLRKIPKSCFHLKSVLEKEYDRIQALLKIRKKCQNFKMADSRVSAVLPVSARDDWIWLCRQFSYKNNSKEGKNARVAA
jgi:hypothetical protein